MMLNRALCSVLWISLRRYERIDLGHVDDDPAERGESEGREAAREGGAQQPAANHRSPHQQPAEPGRALAGRGEAQSRARFVVSPGDIGSEEEADGGKDAGADDYHYDGSELSRALGAETTHRG